MRIREHGVHYHVIGRCNNRERLIVKDSDRRMLLSCIAHYMKVHSCKLYNYAIMPSHIHMIIMTDGSGQIDEFMHDWSLTYAQRFNARHRRCGHLWRRPYFSKVIKDDTYALVCMRYVDRNPVEAGLVKNPYEWTWSGCRYYAYGERNKLLTLHPAYEQLGGSIEDRKLSYRSLLVDSTIAPEDEYYLFESRGKDGSRRFKAAYRRAANCVKTLIKKGS